MRLGRQIRGLRLAQQLDQGGLAERAGVSIGAVKNLEQGHGSSLKTVVKVTVALGHESWLDSLGPIITVSPIDLVRKRQNERVRVYRPRGAAK